MGAIENSQNFEKASKGWASERPRVLIIDDDRPLLRLLNEFYLKKNYHTVIAESAEAGLENIQKSSKPFDLIVSDMSLPKKNGIEFLEDLSMEGFDTPVIFITAYANSDDAAYALRKGAFDYVTKPLNFARLEIVSQRAVRIKDLEHSYARLQKHLDGVDGEIMGTGPKMRSLLEVADKVATGRANILIKAEAGSKKELLARRIHQQSRRRERPFYSVKCSGQSGDELERDLFGTSDVDQQKEGLFRKAQGGTLFLDRVENIPLSLQMRLLHAIEKDKQEQAEEDAPGVRIIASTCENLRSAVSAGEFSEGLFFHLSVVPLQIPPLRERREDILVLAEFFLKKYSRVNGKDIVGFTRESINKLKRLRWQGNVRELENTIERAVALTTSDVISDTEITAEGSFEVDEKTQRLFGDLLTLKELEKFYIQYVLKKAQGKKEEVAEILGINRKTLYRKEREYDIK